MKQTQTEYNPLLVNSQGIDAVSHLISLLIVSILQHTHNMSDYQFIPVLTVYESYVTLHSESVNQLPSKNQNQSYVDNFEKEKYRGFISPGTKRKIRKILTTWLESVFAYNKKTNERDYSNCRWLSFVTLTLSASQRHDDNYIKRNMLMPFIQKLKRKYDIKYYFWRAEKQKNGNIHFHMIVDKFINHKDLQADWNATQDCYGYISRFYMSFQHRNPPSTHVTSLSGVTNPIDYLLKYMTKNDENLADDKMKVKGRVWGCSDELRLLRPFRIEADYELLELLNDRVLAGELKRIDKDMISIYSFDFKAFVKEHAKPVYDQMQLFYISSYAHLYCACKLEDAVVEQLILLKSEPVNPVAVQTSLFDFPDKQSGRTQHYE